MKGTSFIPKILIKLRILWQARQQWLERFQTKIHFEQRKFSNFIKRHRTVKILHLTRKYSALAVVISSSILVAATNAASSKDSDSFLLGFFSAEEKQQPAKKMAGGLSRKENLLFAPLVRQKKVIDPQAEEEEIETIAPLKEKAFLSSKNLTVRDPEEEGGVKIYTVKEGDTVSAIAARNKITVNTILWANDIDNVDSIMPGDKIFILPVAGVSHTVKEGDTIDTIAKKYKADKDKIIAFNDLPADGSLKIGEDIIVPDGQKEIPRPAAPAVSSPYLRQYATPQGGSPAVSGWKKLEGKAGTGHRFPYGYCTWYVSQRRYIPWGGNAGTWLYRAKAAGYLTGKVPRTGSIVVTTESWWGHVGVVESVSGSSITISEMNYVRWGKVNKRTLSTKSRVIKGYIY